MYASVPPSSGEPNTEAIQIIVAIGIPVFIGMLFALFMSNKSQRVKISRVKTSDFKSAQIEPYRRPGRLERMHADPDINTRNWEIHASRMRRFGRSKFQGCHYYVGPRGGWYYINSRGRKTYC